MYGSLKQPTTARVPRMSYLPSKLTRQPPTILTSCLRWQERNKDGGTSLPTNAAESSITSLHAITRPATRPRPIPCCRRTFGRRYKISSAVRLRARHTKLARNTGMTRHSTATTFLPNSSIFMHSHAAMHFQCFYALPNFDFVYSAG